MPLSLDIAIWLLKMRANHEVVNRGEGLLHVLLHRLSACSFRVLHHRSLRETALYLLTMLLLKQEGQGRRQQRCECSSSDSPHLLDALLQRSEAGLTAFDAAMSPAVWPVLCSAVDKAGYSLEAHLREADKRAGVSTPPHRDIEKECDLVFDSGPFTRPLTTPHASSASPNSSSRLGGLEVGVGSADDSGRAQPHHFPAQARGCYVCGVGSETHPRPAPFNLYLPCLVNEQGLDIHDMNPNPDITIESRSGRQVEMSLRRWVAFRLWERGYFS